MTKHYDYFVIGAGSGGVRSARIAAAHGAKVGIAEGDRLGGTCVNRGCIPKKLYSYASHYADAFEEARGFGWDITANGFDWQTLVSKKETEISRLNVIYDSLLKGANVDILPGFAKFKDANTLTLNGKVIRADQILIATGGKPRKPDIAGADLMITSDEAFDLKDLPERIVIYGSGYIAVEFAFIFKGLGAKVDLIYRARHPLKHFDSDIRTALEESLDAAGIILHPHHTLDRVEHCKDQKGKLCVYCSDGNAIICDQAMSAIGRDANTSELCLDKAGVTLRDNGTIPVNENYQTNIPHIYAIGDIANTMNLTPVAIAEGHFLADHLFAKTDTGRKAPAYRLIPTAVFSHPPIATVGMTEEEVLETYGRKDINIYLSRFKPLRHNLSGRDEKTLMKMIVCRKSDDLLGIHIIGEDAPEIMQGFAVAYQAGVKKKQLDRTIGIHPTAAEELVTMREPIEDC